MFLSVPVGSDFPKIYHSCKYWIICPGIPNTLEQFWEAFVLVYHNKHYPSSILQHSRALTEFNNLNEHPMSRIKHDSGNLLSTFPKKYV